MTQSFSFSLVLVGEHCFSVKRVCNSSERGFSVVIGKTCLLHTDCEDGKSTCPLGRIDLLASCIPESGVYDGIEDCIGGTDEVNCGPSKIFNYCSSDRKDVVVF